MVDPLVAIEEGVYLCLRFGMSESPTPANCLTAKDGIYGVVIATGRYHPLETVLVGAPATDAGWLADARNILGVSDEWIRGFMDGFAQVGEQADGQEYRQGYLTAMELTQRCFRRLYREGWK
jgi:hypothetical protein